MVTIGDCTTRGIEPCNMSSIEPLRALSFHDEVTPGRIAYT